MLNAGYLSLYGTCYVSNFFVDFAWWNGLEHVKNSRNVFFTDFFGKAKSSYHCYLGDVHAASGYDYRFETKKMRGILEPFVALDWTYNVEQSFSEHGATPYSMHQQRRFSSILQTQAGVSAYFSWKFESGLFIMRDKFSYINRQPFHVGNATVSIVGSPGSFIVSSFTNNQSLFSPSVQITWRKNKGSYLSLFYDGEFGSGWISNEIAGEIGRSF